MLILVVAICGLIYGKIEFLTTCVFTGLVILLHDYRLKSRLNYLLGIIDEYSFSIYLGHTTVMEILSNLQEQVGFSILWLAVIDLIACVIFIPILHLAIEKPCSNILKRILM